MKTYLTYGFAIALGGLFLNLVSFFLGWHNDSAKFGIGQTVGFIGGVAITITFLVLGMKAVRAQSPGGGLSYGRAVGTGAAITAISGVLGAIFYAVYGLVINPEFHTLIYEAQITKMEEQGMSSAQIDSAAGMVKFFTSAGWMAIASLLFSPIFGTLFSLVIAIFVKRPSSIQAAPAI